MISGRYVASGCSQQYCGWREGKSSPGESVDPKRQEWRDLVRIQSTPPSEIEPPGSMALVRRLMAEERRKRSELEVHKRSLESLLESGQKHIDRLAAEVRQDGSIIDAGQEHIDHLEAKMEKAVADFRGVEAEFREYRSPWLVRAAHKASTILRAFRRTA